MKRVKLRVKEDIKYETIKSCVDHKSPVIAASIKLNLSRRQIFRLINVYKKRGKEGFIHGNRDRKPINTLNKTLSTKIIQLVNKKYKDNNSNYLILNYSHLQDMLKEKHNISISYASLYTLMLKNNFLSPKIQKITKRKIAKEKLLIKKPNTKPEDIEIIVNHIVELEDAHPRKERAKYFGELLQMDACSKIWGNSFFATLHLAIDNSTGNIVGGYFCKEETLLGYYQIFSQILHDYGIPIKIITDKRTVFTYKQLKNKDDDKDTLTQFGFVYKTLGVCLESTSIPQKKGQIERANGTYEDRLSAELRIENITNIEDGNKYLINLFIPKFNEKFGEIISSGNNAFVPVEEDKIDYYLSIISRRQFDKGNSIGYKNEFCQAFRDKKFVCFENKTKCLVVVALNNEKFILVDDQIYEMKKLNKNLQSSLALDQLTPEKAKKLH